MSNCRSQIRNLRITGYLADGGWATEVLVVIDDGQVSDGRDSYLAMGGNPESIKPTAASFLQLTIA
jgi:hypothetical protein